MNDLKRHFLLRPDIAYLNFGSFGACARPVFERYQAFQRELEEEPVQFFMVNGPRYLREARAALGNYVNCHADDVVYVPNPSYAVNIVAKSLGLKAGDKILTTDLEYGACDRTWTFCCGKAGAAVRRQKIRLPVESADEIVDTLFAGANGRTRLIFVSHVTSTTALRLPVEKICARAREMNIPCFVDGAHAPGQVEVDLRALGADYYTGACHKWMMTPKGSAFLYTARKWQAALDPLVVSWGYEGVAPSHSRYLDYHEGQGTRDYSAFLTIPEAIRFMEAHRWQEVAARCRTLVTDNAARFCELLRTRPLAPLAGEFIVQMLSLRVKCNDPESIQQRLFADYQVEVPLMRHGDAVYLRYSINGFNTGDDLDRLFVAVQALVKGGELAV